MHGEGQRLQTLPTFFVIGAPKCGTTSLHAYLGAHPEIEMTAEKEPFVFVAADWPASLSRYAALFRGAAPVRGESSTVYSQHPQYPGVPGRIREVVAAARFVYVVRDPIERAIAHYRQHLIDGKEPRTLAQALADYERPGSVYLAASRYATQLRLYLEHFPAERLLVLDQADLLARRRETLAKVFRFLGVDPGFTSPVFSSRLNPLEDQRPATALGRALGGSRLAGRIREWNLPGPVRRAARRALSRPPQRPDLDPGLRARIAESLGDEVAWLREFSGLGFPGWSL